MTKQQHCSLQWARQDRDPAMMLVSFLDLLIICNTHTTYIAPRWSCNQDTPGPFNGRISHAQLEVVGAGVALSRCGMRHRTGSCGRPAEGPSFIYPLSAVSSRVSEPALALERGVICSVFVLQRPASNFVHAKIEVHTYAPFYQECKISRYYPV